MQDIGLITRSVGDFVDKHHLSLRWSLYLVLLSVVLVVWLFGREIKPDQSFVFVGEMTAGGERPGYSCEIQYARFLRFYNNGDIHLGHKGLK
jgi:hypothetical protein